MRFNETAVETLAAAKTLGLSLAHATMLQHLQKAAKGDDLPNPAPLLGVQAKYLMAFWSHIEQMSLELWAGVFTKSIHRLDWRKERSVAEDNIKSVAAKTNSKESLTMVQVVSSFHAPPFMAEIAAYATMEIQGMDTLEESGQLPYFLAFFGFPTWGDVRKLALAS